MRKYEPYYNQELGGSYTDTIRRVTINNTDFYIEVTKAVFANGKQCDVFCVMGMKHIGKYQFKAVYCSIEKNIGDAHKAYRKAILDYVITNFIK